MTLDEIEDRLHEAITTLAALPDREQRWLKNRMASWPETLREVADVFIIAFERARQGKSAFEPMRAPRTTPSPEQIDNMDEALKWLAWLDKKQRAVIAMRAFGMSWARISWRFDRRGGAGHVSDETVRQWSLAALQIVQNRLGPRITPKVLANLARKA